MELVYIVASGLSRRPVDRDPVPHLVLNDQHPQLLELLAQLLDVEAHQPVGQLHVGPVVEHVEGAGDIQLQRRRDALGLRFRLSQQLVVEVLENGHPGWVRVCQVGAVHIPHTAVNDRFLHRLEAVLAAHHDIAEGEQEVHLEGQGVVVVRVVEVDVHGVDILGASGGDFYHLPAQALDQWGVVD